jgi:hypothetical protein
MAPSHASNLSRNATFFVQTFATTRWKMRKLIMERLNNIWCDELEGIHELAQSEFSLMSDEELLDLYDEVFGFSG